MSTTHADVIARLRLRDPNTLRAVADEHARPLYRAARAMGFPADDAGELVQDVFTTFMDTLDRFEGRSQLRTWLFGILHRKVLERRREQVADARHDSIDEVFEAQFDGGGHWRTMPPGPDRFVSSKQIGSAIRDCVAELPALQRQVFVLREMQGCETAEIGNILGCTVTHLGVLLHRARARLRACLQAKGWGSAR